MDYRVTVTVPVELADTASAVGRAMDVDVGGAHSFVERDGQLVAEAWVSKEFYVMFDYLISRPEALLMAVEADYASRWPDIVPPTLAEIEKFCNNSVMSVV